MNTIISSDDFSDWRAHCARELAKVRARIVILEAVCGFCCEPFLADEAECRHCGYLRGRNDE